MDKKARLLIGALAGLAGYVIGGKATDYVSGKLFGNNKKGEEKNLVDKNGFMIIREDFVEDGDSTDSSSDDGDL